MSVLHPIHENKLFDSWSSRPHIGGMPNEERKKLLEVLRETPARLGDLLADLPPDLVRWTPAPGKWSVVEIVCHLRDMEREAYLARYRRILWWENPLLADIDGDALALER